MDVHFIQFFIEKQCNTTSCINIHTHTHTHSDHQYTFIHKNKDIYFAFGTGIDIFIDRQKINDL